MPKYKLIVMRYSPNKRLGHTDLVDVTSISFTKSRFTDDNDIELVRALTNMKAKNIKEQF